MNGLSMPNAPAFANGVCDTNSSGRSGQSIEVTTSTYSWFKRGNWVGPTRTASAWNKSRIPRSPKKPYIFLTTSSKPGTERRVCSAARSAGCSQATGAIWVRIFRGRAAGTPVGSLIRNSLDSYPASYGDMDDGGFDARSVVAQRLVQVRD